MEDSLHKGSEIKTSKTSLNVRRKSKEPIGGATASLWHSAIFRKAKSTEKVCKRKPNRRSSSTDEFWMSQDDFFALMDKNDEFPEDPSSQSFDTETVPKKRRRSTQKLKLVPKSKPVPMPKFVPLPKLVPKSRPASACTKPFQQKTIDTNPAFIPATNTSSVNIEVVNALPAMQNIIDVHEIMEEENERSLSPLPSCVEIHCKQYDECNVESKEQEEEEKVSQSENVDPTKVRQIGEKTTSLKKTASDLLWKCSFSQCAKQIMDCPELKQSVMDSTLDKKNTDRNKAEIAENVQVLSKIKALEKKKAGSMETARATRMANMQHSRPQDKTTNASQSSQCTDNLVQQSSKSNQRKKSSNKTTSAPKEIAAKKLKEVLQTQSGNIPISRIKYPRIVKLRPQQTNFQTNVRIINEPVALSTCQTLPEVVEKPVYEGKTEKVSALSNLLQFRVTLAEQLRKELLAKTEKESMTSMTHNLLIRELTLAEDMHRKLLGKTVKENPNTVALNVGLLRMKLADQMNKQIVDQVTEQNYPLSCEKLVKEYAKPEPSRNFKSSTVSEKLKRPPSRTLQIKGPSDIKYLTFTCMSDAQMKTLKIAISKLGVFRLVEAVTDKVTHVICGEPKHTITVLKGLLNGCWLLDFSWVLSSIEKEIWQKEQSHLMEVYAPAMKKIVDCGGRSCWFVSTLFETCGRMYISADKIAEIREIRRIVTKAGGQIVSDICSAQLIVGQKPTYYTPAPEQRCVSGEFVVDSICSYTLQPLDFYLQ